METYTTHCGVTLPAVDPKNNFPLVIYKINPEWKEFLEAYCDYTPEIDDDFKKKIAQAACTMYENKGIGIAANQVGFKENWFIIDTEWTTNGGIKKPRVCIRPDTPINNIEKKVTYEEEGCLSVPLNFRCKVYCDSSFQLEYTDLYGIRQNWLAMDLNARAVRHEIDHLQGICIVNYLSKLRKSFLDGKIRKVKRYAKIAIKNHNRQIKEQVKQLNLRYSWSVQRHKDEAERAKKQSAVSDSEGLQSRHLPVGGQGGTESEQA